MFLFSGLALAVESPNVLLICIDDLRPELRCFGAEYIVSPNIDRLASQGRIFNRHFVQAPTCGASRFTLLTGRYGGRGNEALFQRANEIAKGVSVPPSMPAWFREHGYRTVSVGKVSHHPGGRGGPDWDDPDIIEMPDAWDRHLCPAGAWQHPRGFMHGLAHGETRKDAKSMDVFQSTDGDDSIYPDGLTTAEGIQQLKSLASDTRPFFLAIGLLRPHLPFGAPAQYMTPYRDAILPQIPHPSKPQGKTTWHSSSEFMKYNRWSRDPNKDAEFADAVRKHYAACVSYADEQVGKILEQLEQLGLRDDTIIVLWGDHGWHLGEHAMWGKHSLFEESLRSPLIISAPGVVEEQGRASEAVVETIDILPTLCELTGIPRADFMQGVSLVPQLRNTQAEGHSAVSYFNQARTIRTKTHRLIVHRDQHIELYEHEGTSGETLNIAEQAPQIVAELQSLLDSRYADN